MLPGFKCILLIGFQLGRAADGWLNVLTAKKFPFQDKAFQGVQVFSVAHAKSDFVGRCSWQNVAIAFHFS